MTAMPSILCIGCLADGRRRVNGWYGFDHQWLYMCALYCKHGYCHGHFLIIMYAILNTLYNFFNKLFFFNLIFVSVSLQHLCVLLACPDLEVILAVLNLLYVFR